MNDSYVTLDVGDNTKFKVLKGHVSCYSKDVNKDSNKDQKEKQA